MSKLFVDKAIEINAPMARVWVLAVQGQPSLRATARVAPTIHCYRDCPISGITGIDGQFVEMWRDPSLRSG